MLNAQEDAKWRDQGDVPYAGRLSVLNPVEPYHLTRN